LRVLDKAKSRRKLERWMQGSKMVIMSTRSDLRKDTYILNEDAGVWDNGIWYSNATYSYPSRWLWTTGADTGLDLGVECLSPECGVVWDSLSDSVNYGICDRCNSCLDCGEGWLECLCYDPLRNSELEYRYDSVGM
jgi:glutamine amidotransferase